MQYIIVNQVKTIDISSIDDLYLHAMLSSAGGSEVMAHP